ncbi:MAG: hypothetical protein H7Z37_07145, partial [Pyrinomonadaceae bacterium]|nr:hypothetical protein [Pyrinomonadaceae bacterium]
MENKDNTNFWRQTAISAEFVRINAELQKGARIISINGTTANSAKSLILWMLQRKTKKTFVVVSDSNGDLETWNGDICAVADFDSQSANRTDNLQVWSVPSSDNDIYAGVSPHPETMERRALTFWKLTREKPDFLLLTARSLVARTVTPDELKNLGAFLKRDEDFAPEFLIEKLAACGYVKSEPVNGLGQFSSRGGIVDVWSPDCKSPVRIEFFGDTVDSIREFDAETQLSTGQLSEISFAPMREFAASPQDFRDWAVLANEKFEDERFARAIQDRAEFAENGESFSGWEYLLPLLNTRKGSVFDYLPKDCVLIFDEPATVENNLTTFYQTLTRRFIEIDKA